MSVEPAGHVRAGGGQTAGDGGGGGRRSQPHGRPGADVQTVSHDSHRNKAIVG